MIEDTSRQPAVEKFSFIDLNLSNKSNRQKVKAPSNSQSLPQPEPTAASNICSASALTVTSNSASSIDTSWYDAGTAAYNLDLAKIISDSTVDNSSQTLSNRNYPSKILFALASSYCLFVLWWLFGQQGSRVVTMITGGKQIVLASSELQFIDYMERSLNNIDRQLKANRLNISQEDPVYIPVYTPKSATPPTHISSNVLPSLQNSTSIMPVKVEAQSEPVSSQPLKIPAPPPLPAPNLENTSSSSTAQATINNVKPVHTLTGILELGEDRSAALVNVRGKTQRIGIGEEINNSGWILKSISDRQAQISNQGQVRSITVGETF